MQGLGRLGLVVNLIMFNLTIFPCELSFREPRDPNLTSLSLARPCSCPIEGGPPSDRGFQLGHVVDAKARHRFYKSSVTLSTGVASISRVPVRRSMSTSTSTLDRRDLHHLADSPDPTTSIDSRANPPHTAHSSPDFSKLGLDDRAVPPYYIVNTGPQTPGPHLHKLFFPSLLSLLARTTQRPPPPV